jgi:hypothetical protein
MDRGDRPLHRLRAALAGIPPLDRALRRLRRTTEVASLQAELAGLRSGLGAVRAGAEGGAVRVAGSSGAAVPPTVEPFLAMYPPGHFYSPVPDLGEIEAQADRLFGPRRTVPGVALRVEEQLALFRTLAALARESPLEPVPGGAARYGLDNPSYGIGDASMLQAMLRHLRPRRYVEVGSGYTTALALDVNERFLGGALSVTAIEPYPELLRQVTRPGDPVEVLAQPVQSVAMERFTSLESGDVLFIDSSHVLKTGSDVRFLYAEVLPVLAGGVHVHVHDIFWPFEYLRHWVEAGRAWNECYLLQAFLAYNGAFEIALWNHYLATEHRDLVADELPAMLETPGGAFWMRRVPRPSSAGLGRGD